jgi:hypothetical protein
VPPNSSPNIESVAPTPVAPETPKNQWSETQGQLQELRQLSNADYTWQNAAPLAYAGGSLGVLIGADLLNRMRRQAQSLPLIFGADANRGASRRVDGTFRRTSARPSFGECTSKSSHDDLSLYRHTPDDELGEAGSDVVLVTMPISGARRRKSSPFCRVRFFQLKRTRESCPSPRFWVHALILCGQLHRPNVFQDAPKMRLRSEAHGSISVQEGQPNLTFRRIGRVPCPWRAAMATASAVLALRERGFKAIKFFPAEPAVATAAPAKERSSTTLAKIANPSRSGSLDIRTSCAHRDALGQWWAAGQPRPKGVRKFMVEFKGPPLEALLFGVKPDAVLRASRGTFSYIFTEAVPDDVPGHWRAQFDITVTRRGTSRDASIFARGRKDVERDMALSISSLLSASCKKSATFLGRVLWFRRCPESGMDGA